MVPGWHKLDCRRSRCPALSLILCVSISDLKILSPFAIFSIRHPRIAASQCVKRRKKQFLIDVRVAALRVRACVYACLRPKGCRYNQRYLYMISPRSPNEMQAT